MADATWTISASVGKASINKPINVASVQDLLAVAGLDVSVDGIYSPPFDDTIKSFQARSGASKPDGTISPLRPTFKKLISNAGISYTGPDYLTRDPSATWSISCKTSLTATAATIEIQERLSMVWTAPMRLPVTRSRFSG